MATAPPRPAPPDPPEGRRRGLGLERPVLFLLGFVVTLVLVADGVRSIRVRSAELRQGLVTRVELLATVQADALATALWDFDEDKAQALFAALELDPDLAHARLHGPDGEVRWHRGRRSPSPDDLRVARPILAHKADPPAALGELELFVSTAGVEAAVGELMADRLVLLVLTLLAVLATIAFGLRRIGRPLDAIAGTVVRLARGEHGLALPGRERADEIGAVARALEALRETVAEAERLRTEEAQAARLALARIRAAVESAGEPIAVLEADGRALFLNPAAERLLAAAHPRLRRPGGLALAIADRGTRRALLGELRAGRNFAAELELRVGRTRRPVELRIDRIPAPDGTLAGFVAIATDTSERRAAEARIRHLAHHDPLTDLPNRALFAERLEREVAIALRAGRRLALLLLDLDRFKEVNDSLGHPAGDALLCAAAGRLRRLVPPEALVARLGGDEFAILLTDAGSEAAIAATAQRLTAAFAEPFALAGRTVRSGVTIGLAVLPDHATTPADLLQQADLALYRAKAEGRGRLRFFDPEIARALREARELETDLHEALERGWLRLHYQPRFEIATRRLVGAEALLRFFHPVRGLLPPARFVPLAEERGLVLPIGRWVLDRAAARAARWAGLPGAPPRVSFNLSPVQLREDDVATRLAEALARHALAPDRLEVEITEGVLLEDRPEVHRTLERIRALGVAVALDDFGTGHSSLGYLRRFPIDRLKLDRSFVSDLERDGSARAVARTVIGLGHALGMRVTAEGVETEGQLACLAALGCDEAQGFLLGRPVEAEALDRGAGRPVRRPRSVTRRARPAACPAEAAPS